MKVQQKRRFNKIIQDLNSLLHEVRKDYPLAKYYLALDVLSILSGPFHDEGCKSRQDGYELASGLLHYSDGGDW